MRELEALDRRSRRTLLLSSTTLRRHRPTVDRWVAEGYGLTVVPRLDLLGDRPSAQIWVQLLCDTIQEMVRNQHTVVALRSEADPNLDAVLRELRQREIRLRVESCTSREEEGV